jgi:hypothetical protein
MPTDLRRDFGEMRCLAHGVFYGLECPACADSNIPDAPLKIVQEYHYLPEQWHRKLWYVLDDATKLALGDLVFDPRSYAYYAGEVTEIVTEAPARWTITWYKAEDNKPISYYHKGTLEELFVWADPMLQGGH